MKVSEADLAGLPLGRRLVLRSAFLLTREWLLWVFAAAFWVRVLILTAVQQDRPDTGTFLAGAAALLSDPNQLYALSGAWLRRYHITPLPGGLLGFISPPTVAAMFVPFSRLPAGAATKAWVLFDVACVVAAAWLLARHLRLRGAGRAFYWLAVAYFPPVLAEFEAGQIGGPLLLCAIAAIVVVRKRPGWAGALAGLAGSLKFYPMAMLAAVPRVRTAAAGIATFAGALALAFVPLGVGGAREYVQMVLVPALSPQNPDCAFVSVRSSVARYVGGQAWFIPGQNGLQRLAVPWAFPGLVNPLVVLLALALLALTFWACRRSGWDPTFSLALTFGLGAVLPGVVFPYQLLPLLPGVAVVGAAAVREGRWGLIAALTAGNLLLIRQPCSVPLANLWTLGAVVLFVACALGAGLSRHNDS